MKQKLTLLLAIATSTTFAQGGPKWTTAGNAYATGDFLGTTNNFPLDFKTNNALRMQLSNAGVLKINNLAGTGNRLLQTDANGNVLPFAMGTSTQVLYGNGIWGNLPVSPVFSNSTSCIPNTPLWSMGGDNFTAVGSLTQAVIGTCNNADFVLKSHGNNRMWFKQDGTISFGSNLNSSFNNTEYRFHSGALRLSGDNSFGGPMIVFDGGSIYGDWGIEYQPTQFAKAGLNFWKPYGSPNASNYQLFLADDGMIGVGTANPLSRFEVDAWSNDGITVRAIASKKAFSSINKNTNQETFSINADGKTKIGVTGSTDTLLTVNGTLKTTNAISNTLKVNTLAGTANRLLQTDANGNIVALPQGTASQVLLGNGTWGSAPSGTQQSVWSSSVTGVTYFNGNVGINTTNPFTALDINGDLRVSQNVYVGGGLLISDLVNATTELRGLDIRADRDLVVEGFSKFKTNIQVVGTASIQNVNVDGVFNTDTISVINSITSPKGYNFDSNHSFKLTNSTSSNGFGDVYTLGADNVISDPSEPILCYLPSDNNWFQMSGGFISRSYPSGGNQVAGSLSMFSAPWDGSGVIDVGGHKAYGDISNGLLVNYFCGRNTYINTNIGLPEGCGIVSMGRQVEIGIPNSDNSVNLNIKSRTGIARAIQVLDNNDKVNFSVKPNGFVFAREINVMPTNITFPDYVFAKEYKLMPIKEVESFVNINKHLPNIPSAKEVEANGINISELQI